ncbi:8-amino-7-oxononanoate synthase [Helicobacter enhydrae]|uniref:8-amino-7-oxononanoate synthase n=1 Tax=Helicobacter enhydrae TaxID=222136 RepID=A0A1B1U6T8_9HELI|nr:pyridoxal phosphate-dependent aminotransferase family protein [Helicobacter enhydrae]ANV98479.1 8-amino-7-oxononanoate synthase [Helicobacter enhydrae]
MPYSKELQALRHTNLLREKTLQDSALLDFASNDYLGLSSNKQSLTQAYQKLLSTPHHAPRASNAINGYHLIHQELEEFLCAYFGFESCLLFGSGFLANLALFDTLVRKNDTLFVDELYHASGRFVTRFLGDRAVFFKHNDPKDLDTKLKSHKRQNGRILIAIEGVYSMDGDIAKAEFAQIAQDWGAIFIVDEAHSSGTIGTHLKGYFDFHSLPITNHTIKMGTLGKSYGSYGAYVLASDPIIKFLFTRAKSSIYTTALSLFDTALALENLKYVQSNTPALSAQLQATTTLTQKLLGHHLQSQILPISFQRQERMLEVAKSLQTQGFCIGAIRKPTTQTPKLRITLGIKNTLEDTQKLCKILQQIQTNEGF